MLKPILSLSLVFVFALVFNLSYAGLEIDDQWGEIVALYEFEDVRDNGPRDFDGVLTGDAAIVRGGKGKCLRLMEKGSFGSFLNDHHVVLSNAFSIVVWVNLSPQEDSLNIGMHALTEEEDSTGYANISVEPDGNLSGNYYHTATERSLEKRVELQTSEKNVSDNKWHHIAFTNDNGVYNLFIDGNLAARRHVDDYISLWGDKANIYVTNANAAGSFNGRILIEDLGFLETGLSVYEVRAIRQLGFDAFLKAMSVEPTRKMATTWGNIKMQ